MKWNRISCDARNNFQRRYVDPRGSRRTYLNPFHQYADFVISRGPLSLTVCHCGHSSHHLMLIQLDAFVCDDCGIMSSGHRIRPVAVCVSVTKSLQGILTIKLLGQTSQYLCCVTKRQNYCHDACTALPQFL